MTWPKCDLQPEDALGRIRLCHETPIKDYVVARELHSDGTPHIHAFIRYEKKVTYKTDLWDSVGKHGNYQQAKSWEKVIGYCKKDGNFVSNVDVNAAASKKAARNLQLLKEDPKVLVDSGIIGLTQLPLLQKSIQLYHLLEPSSTSNGPRGIWVYGVSGVGKSHFVRSRHSSLYIKPQNKWWCGYTGESTVLLDDFDHNGTCLSHYLKLWADKWSCSGETKGGKVNLHYTTFYVTSQYTIEELWPGNEHDELRTALIRRFTRIGIQRDFGYSGEPILDELEPN